MYLILYALLVAQLLPLVKKACMQKYTGAFNFLDRFALTQYLLREILPPMHRSSLRKNANETQDTDKVPFLVVKGIREAILDEFFKHLCLLKWRNKRRNERRNGSIKGPLHICARMDCLNYPTYKCEERDLIVAGTVRAESSMTEWTTGKSKLVFKALAQSRTVRCCSGK